MIKAKKSLGQNFLVDNNVINKIVDIVEVKNKNILEIGPGTGNLTSKILDRLPKKVTVVEKDSNLVKLLQIYYTATMETGQIMNIGQNITDGIPP